MIRFLLSVLLFVVAGGFAFADVPFKVLTYNAWHLRILGGVYSVSEDTEARVFEQIGAIAGLGPDVVAFQEIWDDEYRQRLIIGLARRGYIYHYFQRAVGAISSADEALRGAMGNGLLIVSRHPIEASNHSAFRDFTRTDEHFVRKGVQYVRVRVRGHGAVEIYNTHAGAVSFNETDYDYAESLIRDEHLAHVRRFIQRTHQSGLPVIFAGDANTHMFVWSAKAGYWTRRLSRGYRLIRDIPGLQMVDTLIRARYADEDDYYANPVYTSSRRNPYVAGSAHFATNPEDRIDYIFVDEASLSSGRIQLIDTRVVLDQPVYLRSRRTSAFLSDHFGVMGEFILSSLGEPQSSPVYPLLFE